MLDVNYFFTIILSLCASVLVCLFCPLCVSVVTFHSEDKDKLEGCGGPSCSCKDDGLIRLVILHALCFFSLSMIYFIECVVCCIDTCFLPLLVVNIWLFLVTNGGSSPLEVELLSGAATCLRKLLFPKVI